MMLPPPSGSLESHDGVLGSSSQGGYDAPIGAGVANTVVASDADHTLRLVQDYPEPLTEPQRRAFNRFVEVHTRRYHLVYRSMVVVRRGWRSLQNVIDRLRKEATDLEEALQALTEQQQQRVKAPAALGRPSASTEDEPDRKRERKEEVKDGANTKTTTTAVPSETTSQQADSVSTSADGAVNGTPSTTGQAATPSQSGSTPSPSPSPSQAPQTATAPRRPGGLLLRRSAMFANMKNVLATAQRQEAQQYAQVTQVRERIAKETRLSLVKEDLAEQEKTMAPLQEKMNRCAGAEAELRALLSTLLALGEEMCIREAQYAASFSLRASGVVAEDDVTLKNSMIAEDTAAHMTVSSVYEIPFTPASFTPEAEDIIRTQVEEVLDGYLTYRARMDPIMAQIEQEAQARQAQRVGQLMEAIGLSGGRADLLLMGFGVDRGNDGAAAVGGGSSSVLPLAEDLPTALATSRHTSHGSLLGSQSTLVKAGSGISDEDEEGGDVDNLSDDNSDDNVGGDHPTNEADRDKQDRQMIQSALSALEDFDALF